LVEGQHCLSEKDISSFRRRPVPDGDYAGGAIADVILNTAMLAAATYIASRPAAPGP
jgi:hypothetical protein